MCFYDFGAATALIAVLVSEHSSLQLSQGESVIDTRPGCDSVSANPPAL